jgi:galactokinase/mevalonate kinase-like predicted kinase
MLGGTTGRGIESPACRRAGGARLGSSGAFTVGLLRALYAYKREHIQAAEVAEELVTLVNVLGQAVGKQDQYIAAFGGFTCFQFRQDGSVGVHPLAFQMTRSRSGAQSSDVLHRLLRNAIGCWEIRRNGRLKAIPR